jgi:predicted nucleic acid-binding protein
MTLYLLDENVIREMRPGGHAKVRAWRATVDASQLRLSAITIMEKRLGVERERRKAAGKGRDTSEFDKYLADLRAFEAGFEGRIIPIDRDVADEWAKLLGKSDGHRNDACLAATCRVHGLVLVSRNRKDFVGQGIRFRDPFKAPAAIESI